MCSIYWSAARWASALLACLSLAACDLSGAATPAPSLTAVVAPSRTPDEPDEQSCSWTSGYGAAPAALAQEAQRQFAETGVAGTLDVSAYGERNSCDGALHVIGVDFEFALSMGQLDEAGMQAAVAKVEPIPQRVTGDEWSLGNVRIKFQNDQAYCWWEAGKGCGDMVPLQP